MSPKKTPKIKAVLFDLGKVILDFDFRPAFKRLSRASGIAEEDIHDFFTCSGLEVLFDGGKISSARFHGLVKEALRHDLNYADFRKIWNGIFTPNAGIVRLIRRLKKNYRLVLVSNTNAMHYEFIRRRYKVLDHFDQHVLSFKEKKRKPDERIYRTAARACRAKPSEIFYIDDREDLTLAASELGFHVFTYKKNTAELIRRMKKLGVHA